MALRAVEALAKINLGLRVLFRRHDGFHELRTVFQTISLSDRIRIRYRRGGGPGVELWCDRADLCGPSNLAAQAATRLLEASEDTGRVVVEIEKRVPVGAGLGGGSSDAAAVLLALADMLRPRPSPRLLLGLARQLGSDVPFFLTGGRALGLGRGDEIYPLPEISRQQWLVIAAPPVPVSTSEAYRNLSPHLTSRPWEEKIDGFCSSVLETDLGRRRRGCELENDFEPVVFQKHPEVELLKARLAASGARPALLCGSGSAVFGAFAERRGALRARDTLGLDEARCFVAQTVNRSGYQRRWRRWLGRDMLG